MAGKLLQGRLSDVHVAAHLVLGILLVAAAPTGFSLGATNILQGSSLSHSLFAVIALTALLATHSLAFALLLRMDKPAKVDCFRCLACLVPPTGVIYLPLSLLCAAGLAMLTGLLSGFIPDWAALPWVPDLMVLTLLLLFTALFYAVLLSRYRSLLRHM